jgi:hypothetical protein
LPQFQVFNNPNDGSKYGDVFKDHEAHISAVDVTGNTSGTAGTATTFAHGLPYTPTGAYVILGNAYVTAVDATNVSVASAGVTQAFRVRVVK